MIKKLDHSYSTDVQSILDLSLLSYRVEADLLGLVDFPPLDEKREQITESTSEFWGYFQDRRLIGVVEVEKGQRSNINRLVVDPNVFRQGAGRKLVQHVLSTYRVCSVTTAKQNLPAISLYRSEGFRSVESFFVEPSLELTTFHTG